MAIVELNWQTAHQHGAAWISHHRLRYEIFVARQNWKLSHIDGIEFDEFDTPAARYLLWLDDDGLARGAVRLISTTRPYMVQKLWPDLLDHAPPVDPAIWEASRFGCDHRLSPALRRRIVSELVHACQAFGLRNGIAQYLAVMPRWIFEQVIAPLGCAPRYAGPRPARREAIAAAYLPVSILIERRLARRMAGVAAGMRSDWGSMPAARKGENGHVLAKRACDALQSAT